MGELTQVMLEEPWRITLCGAFIAKQGERILSRFRTQKTGLLLAYLAYYPGKAQGREELAERFWPEAEDPLHSLRMALASLRQQLEPPGIVAGSVLIADRTHVRLALAAVRTDVAEFEEALRAAEQITDVSQKVDLLASGVDAIAGELLPGCYEEWALQARHVVSERLRRALQELVTLQMGRNAAESALLYALRLLHLDVLNEDAHLQVMRLFVALHRHADAREQFDQLTRLLRQELNTSPSPEACELAVSIGYELLLEQERTTASPRRTSRRSPALPDITARIPSFATDGSRSGEPPDYPRSTAAPLNGLLWTRTGTWRDHQMARS